MSPLKIVILEDDSEDAEIIQDYVTRKKPDCEFTIAHSKEDFVDILNQFQPDIILSDHSMPGFSSTEALTMARSIYPLIPFIIVAGIMPEEFIIEIMKLGADDYISKEKLQTLPAAINMVMRLYRSSKEKEEVLEQLKISEQNYHTVFLESPLPKWIYNIDTLKFLEVNEAAVRHYGFSREEFLQMSLLDIRPKEDVDAFLNYINEIKQYSEIEPSSWTHRKKNGQIIHVEVHSHNITYNNLPARMAIICDITHKKKTEEKIVQSEANLKSIFENTSDGFMLLDKEARIMVFNSKAETYNVFNQTKKFEIGKSLYNFVPDSRKPYIQSAIAQVADGKTLQYDHSFAMEDGSTRWIEFTVTPVMAEDVVKGVCFTGHDVTEKKQAEQEREFERSNLKALINNTKDLMWSMDRDFRLITSNEAFDRTVERLIGSRLPKGAYLLQIGSDMEQLARFMGYYKRVFAGESFTASENMADDFWSEISFYPIYGSYDIIGAACFSRNVTWRKKAEEERLEYAKSLEEMLFKISHQVRVPIANLLGIAHVIEFSDNPDKDIKEIVGYISPTVDTLDAFSRDLAKFIEAILLKKGITEKSSRSESQASTGKAEKEIQPD